VIIYDDGILGKDLTCIMPGFLSVTIFLSCLWNKLHVKCREFEYKVDH